MPTAKLTIFKIYEDIYTKKSNGNLYEDPEFESAMNNFMLCRIFRMNDSTVWIAEKLNQYQTVLSKREFYQFAYSLVQKRFRAPFNDFIKKAKKEDKIVNKKECEIDEDGFLII